MTCRRALLFFSSRRRHTRLQGDWSSDVCSSDLCKYSPAGSIIKVAVEQQQESVCLRVWNSGSLVLSSERARIFERFYRGSEARHLAPGTGLGLYVARKIVQAHGGDLDLETDVSEGTSFRLTLPIVSQTL